MFDIIIIYLCIFTALLFSSLYISFAKHIISKQYECNNNTYAKKHIFSKKKCNYHSDCNPEKYKTNHSATHIILLKCTFPCFIICTQFICYSNIFIKICYSNSFATPSIASLMSSSVVTLPDLPVNLSIISGTISRIFVTVSWFLIFTSLHHSV